jgi:NAD(P)-dependent dehydrogenase (short-subunit alcohol dehydrogenase family)
MQQKVALITGASSGIGKETAVLLAKQGFVVYAAARRVDQLPSDGIHALALDVTDEASMVACVQRIVSEQGRIDVLVNNAGYGSFGALEDIAMDEARKQIEVNVFGLARMIQLVLPTMRSQGSGKIVNVSSVGGKIWSPFGSWYHASKFAVEGLSDCLRMELTPFGIDVIVIQPGAIATPWGEVAADHLIEASGSGAYAEQAKINAASIKRAYSGGRITKPIVIATCIVRAVTSSKPKTRYTLGYGAKLALFIKNLLGDRRYDRFIQKLVKSQR